MVAIDTWVERLYSDERLCLHSSASPCDPDEHLRLDEVRSAGSYQATDEGLRQEIWSQVARLVRSERKGESARWSVIAVWLLLPMVRSGSRVIARTRGAELADVRSAMVTGALTGLAAPDLMDQADIRSALVAQAFAHARRAARRPAEEMPTGSVELWSPASPAAGGERADPEASSWAPHDIICVRWLTPDLARRVQGERLGELAERLGLLENVRANRRRLRSHRAGGRSSGGLGTGERRKLPQRPEEGLW
ncbi:hypothetical protein ABZ832_18950 [Streptantibioticus parmotrematis]|uniref:hypothetical protein n=1 Tax=Streptantibioticus parmotrematis TaxID=2873249 RepID=UPI0033FD6318